MIYVKQSISGKVNDKKQNLNGKLNYKEKEQAEYLVQEKEVTPTIEQQEVTPDIGYNGLSKVTVDAIQTQEKSVIPTTDLQILEPDQGKFISKVTVDAIQTQEKSVIPTTDLQILEPDQGKFISKVTVDAIHTQQKSVKSTTSQQTIEPDKDYYISKITVDPVVYQEKMVTPTRETQTIMSDQNYDGLSQVTVEAIPSNLIDTTDANAVAINIRDGKSAYVNGTKITGTLPVLTYPVNPSSPSDFSYQFIAATAASNVTRDGTNYIMGAYQIATEKQPDSWMFEGNRKMKLGIPHSLVTKAINLKSSQIKSGQTVLGIAGATQGELSVTENGQYNVVNYDSVNVNVSSGGGDSLLLPDKVRFQNSFATNFNFLKKIDTSEMTNMTLMFSACNVATNIDCSNFDTSNVTNMSQMFSSCSQVTTIDVSNFNTEKVEDMERMFASCKNLVNVDVSNFNISNLSNYYNWNNMFSFCTKLSNNSLNSILKMCTTQTSSIPYKTLKRLGLSSEQATICATLSNWDDFIAAKWSSGY